MGLSVKIETSAARSRAYDLLVVGIPEGSRRPWRFVNGDRASAAALDAALRRGELRGRRKDLLVLARSGRPDRLAVIGLGPRDRLSAETVRCAAAEVVQGVRGRGVRAALFELASFVADGRLSATDAARAITTGAILGQYEFTEFKQPSPERPVRSVGIHVAGRSATEARAVRSAVEEERTLADVTNWTRDIANQPANVATPEYLAERAVQLGRELGLTVRVFDERKLAEMGCGGILAVGSGSAHPPRLIVLEYAGRAPSRTVAVVGKGITFDSGGISIKPAPKMSEMKFDKSGAVAVLGILRAAALCRVAPRVVGVLACAENLPSGSAYRPGDLVRTFGGGPTIEVLNTDAEGRVALSDALAYVAKEYAPSAIIDLATLTGAQVTALGDHIAGLVSTDEALARALQQASEATGEGIWRMPLTDYHRELVRGQAGDVRNSTELPVAGMLTAAAFLERFVGDRPWAHLDIAGPAYTSPATRRYQSSYQNAGATGFGVRLVSRYLLDSAA